ncbi:MAG: glutaminyl-peptide cyclotransferase [Candidatus Eremiobacterota bacterium]
MTRLVLWVVLAVLAAGCQPEASARPPETLTYRVVRELPHDPDAFTQGLFLHNGKLLESTGQYGQSTLRRVDRETGKPELVRLLPAEVFGEGMTLLGDRVYQLTWKEHTVLVYDAVTLEVQASLRYPGEGWGLTTDGQRLILSDGSSTLQFLEPGTLNKLGELTVTDRGQEVANLNELEFIQGKLFANVWQTDRIARIDLTTGKVDAWLDLTGLLKPDGVARAHPVDVLNGIAHDPASGHLLVTGKYWPKLFELELSSP